MQDIRVAAAQITSVVGQLTDNVETHRKYTHRAAEAGARIICFPELSLCGYPTGDRIPHDLAQPLRGELVQAMGELSAETGVIVLAGLLERDPSGVVYNTQVVAGPSGIIGGYRKTHVPTSEICRFSHGDELPVFRLPQITFGMQICYDSHFPEASTIQALRGAEVIFLPHASVGGPTTETYQAKRERWLRYMPARAYDNGVYVLVVNQVGHNGMTEFPGVSMVLDPWGAVIAEAQAMAEDLLVVDLSAAAFQERRQSAGSFFAHFRRPELYGRIVKPSRAALDRESIED